MFVNHDRFVKERVKTVQDVVDFLELRERKTFISNTHISFILQEVLIFPVPSTTQSGKTEGSRVAHSGRSRRKRR